MIQSGSNNPHFQQLLDFGANPNDTNGINSALTYSMFTPEVTDNFKKLFQLSTPSNIANAFSPATKENLTNYQYYIVQEIALVTNPVHCAYQTLHDKCGESFDKLYCEVLHDLQFVMSQDYAGGVSCLQLYQSPNIVEFLTNSQLYDHIVNDTSLVPPCYYSRPLANKMSDLRKLK
ncbi:hypothetical protein QAD02_005763 [Eretmocerus hayati]|uniref:Uncharacterized protein n=1 Tax=Eretmocerus hayati TaxID=131215 RepID=A0ACC2NV57_9HYME|nr:hypothetical protein QAD02_005763 [Eretmocerus hayati]